MMVLQAWPACDCPDPIRVVIETPDGRTFVHDIPLSEPNPSVLALEHLAVDGLRAPDDVQTIQTSCSRCGLVMTLGRNL